MANHTKVSLYHQNQLESDTRRPDLYLAHLLDEQILQEQHHLPKLQLGHKPEDRKFYDFDVENITKKK